MCLVELVILYLKTYPRTGAQTVHRMISVQRFTWSMTKMSTVLLRAGQLFRLETSIQMVQNPKKSQSKPRKNKNRQRMDKYADRNS